MNAVCVPWVRKSCPPRPAGLSVRPSSAAAAPAPAPPPAKSKTSSFVFAFGAFAIVAGFGLGYVARCRKQDEPAQGHEYAIAGTTLEDDGVEMHGRMV